MIAFVWGFQCNVFETHMNVHFGAETSTSTKSKKNIFINLRVITEHMPKVTVFTNVNMAFVPKRQFPWGWLSTPKGMIQCAN